LQGLCAGWRKRRFVARKSDHDFSIARTAIRASGSLYASRRRTILGRVGRAPARGGR
jgi:hypothetical protein